MWYLSNSISGVYASLKITGWKEFDALPPAMKKSRWFLYPFPLIYWATYALYAAAGVSTAILSYIFFYRASERHTFFTVDGRWGAVECIRYRLPWRKETHRVIFDRITYYGIAETWFDRRLNTGSLSLYLVSAVDDAAIAQAWVIHAIREPHARARELEAQKPKDRVETQLHAASAAASNGGVFDTNVQPVRQ